MTCDSVNDCGDASDEYESLCSKQITTLLATTPLCILGTVFVGG